MPMKYTIYFYCFLFQDFNAKLVDFGLAKSRFEFWQTIDSQSITRYGIVDPEYIRTGTFPFDELILRRSIFVGGCDI